MTETWAVVARIAGRAGGWQPQRWDSAGGQRVLVIAPHPDDEIGCGGVLLLHERAGDDVQVVYVTDGRGSALLGLTPDQVARIRREEAAAAMPLLRFAGMHWLGLHEYEWDEAALVPALQNLLRETKPQIVYAPSRLDYHPEHIRVGSCLARAMASPEFDDVAVRVYPIQVPLTPVLANLVAPMQSVLPQLIGAMKCYRTQLGSIQRLLRMKRYGASLYGATGLAEEFWQIDRHAYGRLHSVSANDGPYGAFRGVRYSPFTDPLSYLRGLDTRRRLRTLATSS